MKKAEILIRADERMECARIVREYGRSERNGVGPCHAAAEVLESWARLMVRRANYSTANDGMVLTDLETVPEEEAA